MKLLTVLRRFFTPITKGGKNSINKDQTSCASELFQPMATGYLFFGSTAAGEMAERQVH